MPRLLFTIALLVLVSTSYAQAPTTGGPVPSAPAAVPLDGGASLLLAGGVGLAVRKLRQARSV